jgi:hypothetical protein
VTDPDLDHPACMLGGPCGQQLELWGHDGRCWGGHPRARDLGQEGHDSVNSDNRAQTAAAVWAGICFGKPNCDPSSAPSKREFQKTGTSF